MHECSIVGSLTYIKNDRLPCHNGSAQHSARKAFDRVDATRTCSSDSLRYSLSKQSNNRRIKEEEEKKEKKKTLGFKFDLSVLLTVDRISSV
jgi:hypothetical protein